VLPVSILGLGACGRPPVSELLLSADSDLVRMEPETPPPGECPSLPEGVAACEMRLVKIDIDVPGDPGSPRGLTTIVDPTFRDHVAPPVSWGIVAPDDDPTAGIEIVVRGFFGADSDEPHLVEKRVQVEFVEDEIRMLCLDLDSSCVGVACGEDETCDAGVCRPATIDSGALPTVQRHGALPSCPEPWPARM